MSSQPDVVDLVGLDSRSVAKSELLSKHLGNIGGSSRLNPCFDRAFEVMTCRDKQQEPAETRRFTSKVAEVPIPMTFQVSADLQKFMVKKDSAAETWLCQSVTFGFLNVDLT